MWAESFGFSCQYHSSDAYYLLMYHLRNGQWARYQLQFHRGIHSSIPVLTAIVRLMVAFKNDNYKELLFGFLQLCLLLMLNIELLGGDHGHLLV
jgi:hypothetical protein